MKFRKKPVVIEAYELPPSDGNTRALPPPWLMEAITKHTVHPQPNGELIIETLEGNHLARIGDWIIQGVKGELYPCKPDIFAATYEPAE